jgi:hypothetical protein
MDDEVHPKLSRHGVPMDDEIHHRGSSITELYWGSSNGCEVSSWVHPLLRRDGMPMDDELVAVGSPGLPIWMIYIFLCNGCVTWSVYCHQRNDCIDQRYKRVQKTRTQQQKKH